MPDAPLVMDRGMIVARLRSAGHPTGFPSIVPPYPVRSRKWRAAMPVLSGWQRSKEDHVETRIEDGLPWSYGPHDLPSDMASREARKPTHALVRMDFRDVRHVVSRAGFLLFRGDTIMDGSSALPNRTVAELAAQPAVHVKRGFYVGDFFSIGNICHSTLDYVCRAFLARTLLGTEDDVIAFPQDVLEYQRYIRMNTFPRSLTLQTNTVYHFDELSLFRDSVSCFNHPARNCDARFMRFLRSTFPAHPSASRPHRRLYLTRKGVRPQRAMLNEDEIERLVASHGFEIVNMGVLPPEEQIRKVQESAIIVAPHGAALTSIVFCQPGTKVIELMPMKRATIGYYKVARSIGLDYEMMLGRPAVDPPLARLSWELPVGQLEQRLREICPVRDDATGS